MEDSFLYRCAEVRARLMSSSSKESDSKSKKSVRGNTWLHPCEYYEENVAKELNIETFLPEVEFVETKEQRDLWNYFKFHTSSAATSANIGRHMKILVKDAVSRKYIGVLALGSDVYAGQARDAYIGWDAATRSRNLKKIANVWACVGLQPVSYHYNIG